MREARESPPSQCQKGATPGLSFVFPGILPGCGNKGEEGKDLPQHPRTHFKKKFHPFTHWILILFLNYVYTHVSACRYVQVSTESRRWVLDSLKLMSQARVLGTEVRPSGGAAKALLNHRAGSPAPNAHVFDTQTLR